MIYESRTLLGLDSWTRVGVRHDTSIYTELYHFLKLLFVSACLCHV